MAITKKYVSIEKLGVYDEQNKIWTKAEDEKVLAAAKKYADDLADNYDAAGSAATAEANAKAHADAEVAKANAAAEAAQAQADKGVADAATADGKAVQAQADVDALKELVGTLPEGATATDVVGYVQEKTTGIATNAALSELTDRVTQAETDIDNIEKDYLKASDKTELEGKIGGVQTAVDTEKARAEGIEAGLESRLAAVEGDYLKAADKTELQGKIDEVNGALEVLTEGVDATKIDGVKDLIKYVEDHGPEVTGMKADIAANTAAIGAEETRAKAAEQANATAAANAQTAAENAQAAAEAEAARAAGVESGLDTRLKAVEDAVGESGSVADDIATAKQEAIDAAAADATAKDSALETLLKKYADDEDAKIESRVGALETASATHALASDLNSLAGRVATAEGEIDTLQTEMDAVEALASANKTAHEANAAAIALKASQADLNSAVDRIAANEAGLAAFVECSEQDILDMFK